MMKILSMSQQRAINGGQYMEAWYKTHQGLKVYYFSGGLTGTLYYEGYYPPRALPYKYTGYVY